MARRREGTKTVTKKMVKLELLADLPDLPVEEVLMAEEHGCSPDRCESSAFCNGCGATGDKESIFIFTDSEGLDYFECRSCIDDNPFIRFAEVVKIPHPETGEEVAPWTAPDGWPLESDGTRSVGDNRADPAGDSQAGANAADGVA